MPSFRPTTAGPRPSPRSAGATTAGRQAPATGKAQVVVFIDLEQLTDAVRGASGFGTTLAGQVLSPQLTRKLACDASIIPMVLGSQGQPLDVGRTKRLLRAHHHTYVHQQDLTATVTAHDVTWHT